MQKIYIIGIGDDGLEGLTVAAKQRLEAAQLVLGAAQSLALLPKVGAEKFEVGGDLEAVVDKLQKDDGKRTVILAYGDPLFYGTARYLCQRLGKERFEVLPHVSSMQLAFARVKESWDDAYLASLTAARIAHVAEKIRTASKVGLFTTEEFPPAAVAKALLERKLDYFTAYVCENLGSPDECVTQGELSEVAEMTFSPLNVMILIRKPDVPDRPAAMVGKRLFGNPDEAFLQSQPKRGLLTPAEVRSIALASLDIGPTSTIWDVGAGSGSVAIEAAQLAAGGKAYAIEMDPDDYQLILSNAQSFGVTNLEAVLGKAPEAWNGLPKPDCVFVGGTGRQVNQIVELAFDELRPGGRLVANVGSIENLAGLRESLRKRTSDVSVLMVNLARGIEQLDRMRFESTNPTFLVSAKKPG